MDVGMGDQNTTILLPFEKKLQQSKDMTQFSIIDFAVVNATHPKTGIHMMIIMKRKIMSEMMTTYFPSLLLMMITYATTFFKPFFFEAALSVNLTTMLVMTTIFISKMEGLPPTSATKMIDYWLIFCQLIPFAQVVLITAMEYLREEPEKNHVERTEEAVEAQQGNANEETVVRIEVDPPSSTSMEVEKNIEAKQLEAWTCAQMGKTQTRFLSKLMIIGK